MGRLALGWLGVTAVLVCSATAWAQEGQERREGRRERGQEEARREGRRRGRGEMRMPDELREFAEDFAPGRLEELERLRERDPARAREMMGRLFMEKRRMDKLKETDPEAYERRRNQAHLEYEAKGLVAKIREGATDAEKAEAKKRLAEIVAQLFEAQCEEYQGAIDQMQERVEQMRAKLEQRRAAKDKIVARRVEDLCVDPEALRWDIQGEERDATPGARGRWGGNEAERRSRIIELRRQR